MTLTGTSLADQAAFGAALTLLHVGVLLLWWAVETGLGTEVRDAA